MLSLAGFSGAAFVMMSCKAPSPVPLLRPAMGDGLLGADTTPRATGTHSTQESRLVSLLPKAGDSAAQGRLPFYNGAGQKQVLSALGPGRRPPHSTRGARMLAHDGSTSTPTATATALALAMMLAFAPMGDAQAAVGDCYGVRYDGLCYGVGSIEVSKEHISSSAPTRRVQVQDQNLAAGDGRRRPTFSDIFETEEDVKALQARVATIEMTQKQVPVPLAFPAPVFAFFLACNVAGGALTAVLLAAFVGFELTNYTPSIGLLMFAAQVLQHCHGGLLHPDVGFQRMIGLGCFDLGYPALAAAILFVRAYLSEINSNEKDSSC